MRKTNNNTTRKANYTKKKIKKNLWQKNENFKNKDIQGKVFTRNKTKLSN